MDDRQLGGTFTAGASRAAGQSDTLTLKGDWAAGSHRVDVNFLNDAWGGNAGADRNLYVGGATYNTQAVAGASQSLLSSGTKSFSFTEPGAAVPSPTPTTPPPSSRTETDRPLFESFAGGLGAFTHRWGNIDTSRSGEVTLTGNSGMMEHPNGLSSGHGYGTYRVQAKLDGNQPGPAIVLWPGNDVWPGQEIDMAEVVPDGSGRHYGTVHWNNNGADAYQPFVFDGVTGGVFHDYSVNWQPGRLTFSVDGVQRAVTTSHVPTDYDAGGMNNVIGWMNNSPNTSITVREVEYHL